LDHVTRAAFRNLGTARARPVIGAACAALLLLAGCDEHQLPERISEPRPHVYVYGDRVGFGYGGDANRFRRDGWAKTEEKFTWTKGLGATMHFRVFSSDEPVTLKMKMNGVYKSPELPFQPVDVSVNGRKIATWKVSRLKWYSAVIPREMVDLGPNPEAHTAFLVIDLYTPRSRAPSDLNTGRDSRRLGVCVWELFIVKGAEPPEPDQEPQHPETPDGSAYTYGTTITFGMDQPGDKYKLSGWHDADSTFTWTGKAPAVLGLRVPPARGPLTLNLRLAALVKGPRLPVQPVQVRVNGQVVGEWQVGEELQWFSAPVPAELANQNGGVMKIEFTSPKAVSPNVLGINADLRSLGIQLHELNLTESE
jgi:hypothetical protein